MKVHLSIYVHGMQTNVTSLPHVEGTTGQGCESQVSRRVDTLLMLSRAELSTVGPIWTSEKTLDSATRHLNTSAPYAGESLGSWEGEISQWEGEWCVCLGF